MSGSPVLPSLGKNAIPRWNGVWLAGWVLLTIYFLAPPDRVMTWELDSSNYGSYSWMAASHKQFGTEVIPMTGPYGYLAYGTTYTGELSRERFIGDLLLKSVFAFLTLSLARQIFGTRRWLWLASIIIFLPNVRDLFYDFTILVAGLWLLTGNTKAHWSKTTLLAAALLGFMALMKGTNALVSGATLSAVLLHDLLERRRARAVLTGCTALVVFVSGWVLAKQNLAHIPAYFRGVWELATGYNESMGLDSSPRELVTGLILVGGLVLLFTMAAWSARFTPARLIGVLYLAGFSFLKWKHGFLRADGHVFIFFNYATLAVPTLVLAAESDSGTSRKFPRVVALTTTLTVFLTGAIASSEYRWGRFAEMLTAIPGNLFTHLSYVVSPGKIHTLRESELAQQRVIADLPQVRAEVGSASIDFFGYEQGILMLNGLNYHPRPMGGGSFNVYTRYLQEKNEAFLRDVRQRPEFQLVKLQTVDDRLPTADDPLTLNTLLHLYAPVRAQRDYLLFRKLESKGAPLPTAIKTVTVRAGEAVAAPSMNERELLLFSVKSSYSLTGHARSFFYRPPGLEIEISRTEPADKKRFRIAPAMAKVPIILSPLLENNRDLLGLYQARLSHDVKQITLLPENPDGFTREFEITFYKLSAPPIPADDIAPELSTYLEHSLTNRTPIEITAQQTGIHELYGEPITLVHAPGHIIFLLQPGDQQVIFNYGLMPQAYDPGRTKGVEFRVETLGVDGKNTVIFSRLLEPVTQAGDRGMQWARVFLPPHTSGDHLILRTNTGPTGDGAWAQSYFAHIQIKSGPLDVRQFTGFSVRPLPPGFTGYDELIPYARKARAFAPPATFTFPIPTGARHVAIAVGLQPAAYQGTNQTNGIAVLVSVEAPGLKTELLERRYLNPLQNSLDRGTQTFAVNLPNDLPANAQLLVHSDPGPNNDDRWDWGYLETVHFGEF